VSTKTTIQINSLKCFQTSEPGHDEVYLICQADGNYPFFVPAGIWHLKSHPVSMGNGDVWYPVDSNGNPYSLHFEDRLVITAWDSDVDDDPGVASYLVNFYFSPDMFSTGKTQTQQWVTPGNVGYDACYSITVTLVD
jgi:hypothetical protein